MSKQDSNGVRTAQDLERKYDFASLLGMKKNVEMQAKSLIKLDNEINSMLNTLIINLKDVLESQSEVSLWFSSEVPTTSNWPDTSWSTPSDHYGDIYYNRATGYVYQYFSSGWTRNQDYNLVQAMAITNAELGETSRYERKVFFTQPSPPYTSGDWWVKEDGTLFICQLGKGSGTQFEENDFIVSSKYTTTVAIKQNDEIKVLKGQIVTITEDMVTIEDLATGGRTTINGANITTGEIDASVVAVINLNANNITSGKIKSVNYVEGSTGMLIDLDAGTITTKNTKWDANGNLCFSNNAHIIDGNGILTNLQYHGCVFDNEITGVTGSLSKCGYSLYTGIKDQIVFNFKLPNNFVPTQAYIEVRHCRIHYNDGITSRIGYTRKAKLYKVNTSNLYLDIDEYDNYRFKGQGTLTEISGALGSNGFTGSSSSDGITKYAPGTNILSSLGLSTSDINQYVIQSSEADTMTGEDKYTHTGAMAATLNIIGYLKI